MNNATRRIRGIKTGPQSQWDAFTTTVNTLLYQPDVEAARALYAAIAAHSLPGQPVWPMLVAPPGSAKTTFLEPLNGLPKVHSVDKLTPNTLLSGQIGQRGRGRAPSLLHRIGADGIVIFSDFSTVLGLKADDRATILADLRRVFDGRLRKETGTSEDSLEWEGRITCAVAVTPEIEKYSSVSQSLGERFLMIRWRRAGGDTNGEQAALHAMRQNIERSRGCLTTAVADLFKGPLPTSVTIPARIQRQIAALAEFVARGRTHVSRDQDKQLHYAPEAEAPTRLAQQLCQLAKGSACLARRAKVNAEDYRMVVRVACDCLPSIRAELLGGLINGTLQHSKLPRSTKSYAGEDLQALGLINKAVDGQFQLSALGRGLLNRANVRSLNIPSERVKKEKARKTVARRRCRGNSSEQIGSATQTAA